MAWQPIDTAPNREASYLAIVFCHRKGGSASVIAARRYPSGRWVSEPGYWDVHPTHWMPLPDPPVAS